MNPPQVYMCSPSWTLLPPPSPYHPSGSSQCTSPKHPVSCIEPRLATRFIHDILHVSMPLRIHWLYLLAAHGTLKSLLQHYSSKPSILQCSAFYIVQLTSIHDHWKNHSLTTQTFVFKVMSLLFNMVSSLVIDFLPRSKHLLISWLQSTSAVILEPKKINPLNASIVSPSICHEVMGPDAMIFFFLMLSFKPAFSFSSCNFNNRLFSSSSISALRVVLSAYLRLLIFLPEILIPAYASSSPQFYVMYSA